MNGLNNSIVKILFAFKALGNASDDNRLRIRVEIQD